MNQIKRVVLGEPSAQQRHRSFQMKGTDFISNYDPSAKKKGSFRSVLDAEAPEVPLEGPLMLELDFYMGRPKCHYGSGKNSNSIKSSAPEWHTGRPDLDNLTKFVQDALNKVYWRDDSIICQVTARKLYSEKPRTEITITKLL
jgi:Holliday junction resolvase RusA-like endonuclease